MSAGITHFSTGTNHFLLWSNNPDSANCITLIFPQETWDNRKKRSSISFVDRHLPQILEQMGNFKTWIMSKVFQFVIIKFRLYTPSPFSEY